MTQIDLVFLKSENSEIQRQADANQSGFEAFNINCKIN